MNSICKGEWVTSFIIVLYLCPARCTYFSSLVLVPCFPTKVQTKPLAAVWSWKWLPSQAQHINSNPMISLGISANASWLLEANLFFLLQRAADILQPINNVYENHRRLDYQHQLKSHSLGCQQITGSAWMLGKPELALWFNNASYSIKPSQNKGKWLSFLSATTNNVLQSFRITKICVYKVFTVSHFKVLLISGLSSNGTILGKRIIKL